MVSSEKRRTSAASPCASVSPCSRSRAVSRGARVRRRVLRPLQVARPRRPPRSVMRASRACTFSKFVSSFSLVLPLSARARSFVLCSSITTPNRLSGSLSPTRPERTAAKASSMLVVERGEVAGEAARARVGALVGGPRRALQDAARGGGDLANSRFVSPAMLAMSRRRRPRPSTPPRTRWRTCSPSPRRRPQLEHAPDAVLERAGEDPGEDERERPLERLAEALDAALAFSSPSRSSGSRPSRACRRGARRPRRGRPL